MRRPPLAPPGLALQPQAVPAPVAPAVLGGAGYPVPMQFDAPPPVDQQGDEDAQQALGGLALAIQKNLAGRLPSGTAARTVDAPARRFPNPMQAQQLDQALMGGMA